MVAQDRAAMRRAQSDARKAKQERREARKAKAVGSFKKKILVAPVQAAKVTEEIRAPDVDIEDKTLVVDPRAEDQSVEAAQDNADRIEAAEDAAEKVKREHRARILAARAAIQGGPGDDD